MSEQSGKIKVIVVLSRIIIGGPANFVELYATHLPKDTYKVLLVGGCVEEGELNKAQLLKEKGIQVHLIDIMKRELSFFYDIKSVYKLYKFIKKEKPHIVSTHTAKAGAVGRIAARCANVPVVLHTFHGHTFENYFSPAKTEFYKIVERVLGFFSTKIISISPLQRYDLVKKFKIASMDKVVTIPIAIDSSRFLNLERNNEFRDELKIPKDDFVIGMVARIVPIKNHKLIIDVLKELHNRGVKAHLLVVGDGEQEYKTFIEQYVDEKNLKPFVHFTGWVLNVEKVYSALDVLALTSLNEGTPVSIIEAMAASVPVVATDVGGVNDLLHDNKNGLLCKSNDPLDMVEKMLQVKEDIGFRNEICKNGREFVKEHYNHITVIKRVDQFQRELLQKFYEKNPKFKC